MYYFVQANASGLFLYSMGYSPPPAHLNAPLKYNLSTKLFFKLIPTKINGDKKI